jgi:D-proline reductase (dithiol) PrdB
MIMNNTVDSYRFISGITRRMIKNWIGMETPRPIPWTPLSKPLSDCTVAMLSSAGLALSTDKPFDQEGERQNPWWGDPSYRILPKNATPEEVRLYHMHVDPSYAEQDLNCLFPLQRLEEMEANGRIRRSSPRHYSMMGYILDPCELIEETTPKIIRNLREDLADVVILVPA